MESETPLREHGTSDYEDKLFQNRQRKTLPTRKNNTDKKLCTESNNEAHDLPQQNLILKPQEDNKTPTHKKSQIDLSFLRPIAVKRKVVDMFSNTVSHKKTQQVAGNNLNLQVEVMKLDKSSERINKDSPAKQLSKEENKLQPTLNNLLSQLAEKQFKDMSDIQPLNAPDSNLAQTAFRNYLDKKREKLQTKEEFFNELLQETRDNYRKSKQSSVSSLRDLASVRLGLKLKRKANNLEKEFHKFRVEHRAETSLIYKIAFKVVSSRFFSGFITLCIIGNTIVLAMDRYPIDNEQEQLQNSFNMAFSVIFILEMPIKLLGLGFKGYFSDAYNAFDCLIAVTSLVDLLVSSLSKYESIGVITSLRTFRLLRIFKLAKSWKQLHGLLKTMGKTLKDVSTFSVLLFLFIFTYTLLGMELFAYQAKFDENGNLDMVNGKPPDANFDQFLDAFTTVFIVLTNDVWSKIYFNFYRAANHGVSATFFFITLIIIGQKVLLNLFLAILLENFDEDSLNQELKKQFNEAHHIEKTTFVEKIVQKVKEKVSDFFSLNINFKSMKIQPKISHNNIQTNSLEQNHLTPQVQQKPKNIMIKKHSANGIDNLVYLDGKALYFLKMDNPLRILLFNIVTNIKFDYFIILVILISSIQLALENPLNNPNGQMVVALNILDILTTSIFSVESFLKILTFGFILNGRSSYLRNPWNMMDFIIIVLSIISLTPLPNSLNIVKVLRVLRPLRLISRNKRLKVAVKALGQALPNIANISIISLLFFMIFGIIGVNYFKGALFICNFHHFENLSLVTKWDCMNGGGDWLDNTFSYNNIVNSIQTFFQLATTIDWSDIMFQSMSYTQIDYVMVNKNRPYWSLFFIFFIIIGAFFFFNLFVGVVISTFNREKDKIGGNNLLTDRQKEWIDLRLLIINSKPLKKLKPPINKLRSYCFTFAENPYFDKFIYITIILNTITLTLLWYDQPLQVTQATNILNDIFTGIFVFEATIKITAYGKIYFHDGWNQFDFIVALGTTTSIFLSTFTSLNLGGATSIVRAFRVTRVMRLVKRAQSLRLIFNTFIVTLPALINVGALLLLIQYLYSVLGVFMFAQVERNGILNEVINYENFVNAFITLFIVSTGDSWDEIMDATIKQREIDFQCVVNPSYQDYVSNGYQTIGCGGGYAALLFYYSYFLLVDLILLKLFIAIILQGFEDTQIKENRIFNNETLQKFRKVWADFDPEAQSFIPLAQLRPFLFSLGAPLGWDKNYENSVFKQEKFIISLNLPTYNNFSDYQFLDVLDALSLRLMVHENYVKERIKKENQNEDEELVVSDNSQEDEESRKRKMGRMNTSFQIQDFQKKMVQDINKLQFQEEAQNIEAVQQIQSKELKVKNSQNNLQKDYYTSLHQAAAELAINQMRYLVAQRRLRKQIEEMDKAQLEEAKKQNDIIAERSIHEEQSSINTSNHQPKSKFHNVHLKQESPAHQRKSFGLQLGNDGVEEITPSRRGSLPLQTITIAVPDTAFNEEQYSNASSNEEIKVEPGQIQRILEQEIMRSRRSSSQNDKDLHSMEEGKNHTDRNQRQDNEEGHSRIFENKRPYQKRITDETIQGTMGGTGENLMVTDECQVTYEQAEDYKEQLSRQNNEPLPSSRGGETSNQNHQSRTDETMNIANSINQSAEASRLINEELGRSMNTSNKIMSSSKHRHEQEITIVDQSHNESAINADISRMMKEITPKNLRSQFMKKEKDEYFGYQSNEFFKNDEEEEKYDLIYKD